VVVGAKSQRINSVYSLQSGCDSVAKLPDLATEDKALNQEEALFLTDELGLDDGAGP
jgi:hypothetical protein